MALDDFGLSLGPLQQASLKQDSVVQHDERRMETHLPKQLPVNRDVQNALAELKGAVEWLHRAAMTTGLTTRFPHNFQNTVLDSVKELVDIAQMED
jgi:hypothetical protein